KRIFARFMDALAESRRQQARRMIEDHAYLVLAAGGLSDNESQRSAHGHRPDDCKRLRAIREAALKELVWTNLWFFAAALAASKAPIHCPITGYPCEGDISHLCEDYGCARKGGLSPCSDENL